MSPWARYRRTRGNPAGTRGQTWFFGNPGSNLVFREPGVKPGFLFFPLSPWARYRRTRGEKELGDSRDLDTSHPAHFLRSSFHERRSDGTSTVTCYTYDSNGRLTDVEQCDGEAALATLDTWDDPPGARVHVRARRGAAGLPPDGTRRDHGGLPRQPDAVSLPGPGHGDRRNAARDETRETGVSPTWLGRSERFADRGGNGEIRNTST